MKRVELFRKVGKSESFIEPMLTYGDLELISAEDATAIYDYLNEELQDGSRTKSPLEIDEERFDTLLRELTSIVEKYGIYVSASYSAKWHDCKPSISASINPDGKIELLSNSDEGWFVRFINRGERK